MTFYSFNSSGRMLGIYMDILVDAKILLPVFVHCDLRLASYANNLRAFPDGSILLKFPVN